MTPDFSISVPPSVTVLQGSSASLPLTVNPLNDFTGIVTVSLEGTPAGVSAPQLNIPAGQSSKEVVSVGSTVAPGSYTVKIQGAAGSLVHQYDLTITVTGISERTLIYGTEIYPGEKISAFLLDPSTGSVTTLSDPAAYLFSSAHAGTPSADPLGQLLLVPECSVFDPRLGRTGQDRLNVFSITPSTGSLSGAAQPAINYAVGECVNSTVFSPDGTTVYVLTGTGTSYPPSVSNVYSYQINRPALTLTEMPGSPLRTTAVLWTLALHPAGHSAYGLAFGADLSTANNANLQVFTIDSTGHISETGTLLDTTAHSADSLLVSPNGNFLILVCGTLTINSVPLDPSGKPGTPASVSIPFPPKGVLMDAQGRFLFITQDTTTQQTSVPIYSVALDSVTGKAGTITSSSVDVAYFVGAVTTEKSGLYLLVNDSDTIFTTYVIDRSTGALTKQPGPVQSPVPPDFFFAVPEYVRIPQ